MKKMKGSRTEHNLMAAFAGESQARNRYTFYAGIASKEGHEGISAVFLETAEHEKMHAKRYFELLEGLDVEIRAGYPSKIGGAGPVPHLRPPAGVVRPRRGELLKFRKGGNPGRVAAPGSHGGSPPHLVTDSGSRSGPSPGSSRHGRRRTPP